MLWVFGCSFSVAEPPSLEDKHPSWPEILAGKMKLTEYRNYAHWGVSNEYIIDQFMKHDPEIQPGDTVIIQLTEKSRQWFIKDSPEISNFYVVDLENHVSKEQKKAIDMYIAHLDRDETQVMRYALTCMAINHISDVRQDVRVMILPGFNAVPGVVGTMLEICNNEFATEESRLNWYNKHLIDIRTNHMSEINHHILAEKIFHVFNTGTVLDLTTGFKTGFL